MLVYRLFYFWKINNNLSNTKCWCKDYLNWRNMADTKHLRHMAIRQGVARQQARQDKVRQDRVRWGKKRHDMKDNNMVNTWHVKNMTCQDINWPQQYPWHFFVITAIPGTIWTFNVINLADSFVEASKAGVQLTLDFFETLKIGE